MREIRTLPVLTYSKKKSLPHSMAIQPLGDSKYSMLAVVA